MAIEFKIDTEARVVFLTARGNVSPEEFQEYRSKLTSHPDFNKEFSELVDYREVTMVRDADHVRRVAQTRPFARVAIVAGEKTYGFARMVQGWAGGEEGGVSVFRDMASAREWLGLPNEDDS